MKYITQTLSYIVYMQYVRPSTMWLGASCRLGIMQSGWTPSCTNYKMLVGAMLVGAWLVVVVLSERGAVQDLRSSIATSNLQKATGQSAANQLFVLQNATLVEREAICGNLVCEAGERSSGTGEGMLLVGLQPPLLTVLTCLSWG